MAKEKLLIRLENIFRGTNLHTHNYCMSFGSVMGLCGLCKCCAYEGLHYLYTVLCAVTCRRAGQKHNARWLGLHGTNFGVCVREVPAGVLLLRGQVIAHNVSSIYCGLGFLNSKLSTDKEMKL